MRVIEVLSGLNMELARKLELNSIGFIRSMHGINGSKFFEDATIATFLSGYPVLWMNSVHKINVDFAKVSDKVRQVVEKYERRQCPFTCFLSALSSQTQRVKEVLKVHGLSPGENNVGMVLDPSKLTQSRQLPELRIEEVDRSEKAGDWLKPFANAFSASEIVQNHFDQLIHARMSHAEVERYFVGYINEMPVTTASYFIDNDLQCLYTS